MSLAADVAKAVGALLVDQDWTQTALQFPSPNALRLLPHSDWIRTFRRQGCDWTSLFMKVLT